MGGFPGGKKTKTATEHMTLDCLMISANLSLLKVGTRLRVKWVDLDFASTVITVFS